MRLFSSSFIILGGLLLVACGDKAPAESSTASAGETSAGTSTGTTEPTSASDPSNPSDPSSASQSDPSTSDPSGPGTGETGSVFLQQPDGGISGQCDPMAQDCPTDQKCTAVSDAPGEPWGINICVPLNGDSQVGDPCDIEDGKYTGLDNCGVGMICLLTDDEGVGGACVEFCNTNSACPKTPGANCVVYNSGSLPICLNSCDPLVQDCPEGQACYNSAGDQFVCFKESAMPGEGGPGSSCVYINQCQKGSFCGSPDAVANCGAEAGCCTPYCSVSGGAAPCQVGEDCLPFFDGAAPPGLGDVGVCAIPG